MAWHLLPQEMRVLNQWVCADDKKQPRNPKTGDFAEVNQRSTWGTFAEATKCAIANGWEIGFILSEEDDFTIVDLDDKPEKPAPAPMKRVHFDIINNADTYIERSTSGTGYHVVIRGEAPKPIKTDWVEMYSSFRLMICTGYVVKNMPVADGMPLIQRIDEFFGKDSVYVDPLGDLPDQHEGVEELSDAEIITRGLEAENGDKFQRLWDGRAIQDDYNGDHSRADSALLNLLCFLTPHNEQVRRIFKESALYRPNQRNRASNKYLNYSIHKWRAENPPINIADYSFDIPEMHGGQRAVEDLDRAVASLEDQIETAEAVGIPNAPRPLPKMPSAPKPSGDKKPWGKVEMFPPGLIGDLAQYCYETSYSQVPDGALVAALGYICGLGARGYQINQLGLNQYLVFLADSGVGKEGGKRGIRAVHKHVYANVPAAQHCLGSSDFSAGVSMVKELAENPCMLGVAGEIGMTLKIILDPRAQGVIKELKRALTDAWSESGPNGLLHSRKYSDRSKNGSDVKRPALSIIGESVPSHFFGALSAETANDGFITRWIIAFYEGMRPFPNRDAYYDPPEALVKRLQDLFIQSKTAQDAGQMIAITMHDDAKKAFHDFEDDLVRKIRELPNEHPIKAILNRTNEKALKIAGTLAMADNPSKPVVTLAHAKWAMQWITHCDGHMIKRFEEGAIGEDEDSFEGLLRQCIRAYVKMTPAQKASNKCPKCLLDSPVIPHASIKHFLKQRAAIKNHRFGALKAIDLTINDAIISGVLLKVPPSEKLKLGLRGGEAFLLGDGW
jgi:hypothetical protein